MIEIRIHGRGGQGNVVAAYALATAAIDVGRHAQAFPAFGAERRGAPIAAFVRISNMPIRRRCQVLHPAFVLIQDETLLQMPEVRSGLLPGGGILINSGRDSAALSKELGQAVYALPATQLSTEQLGRPMPNTALLAAFLTLTGLLPLDGLIDAISQRFKGDVLARNIQLIRGVASQVPAGLWQEMARATST